MTDIDRRKFLAIRLAGRCCRRRRSDSDHDAKFECRRLTPRRCLPLPAGRIRSMMAMRPNAPRPM